MRQLAELKHWVLLEQQLSYQSSRCCGQPLEVVVDTSNPALAEQDHAGSRRPEWGHALIPGAAQHTDSWLD